MGENGNNCKPLLELLEYLKENGISLMDFKDKVDISKKIDVIPKEYDQLDVDIFDMKETLNHFQMKTKKLQNKYNKLKYYNTLK